MLEIIWISCSCGRLGGVFISELLHSATLGLLVGLEGELVFVTWLYTFDDGSKRKTLCYLVTRNMGTRVRPF